MTYDLKKDTTGAITLNVQMTFKTYVEAMNAISVIEEHGGLPSLSAIEIELIPYLKEGKLQAVKFYKDKTGNGLKDSKDYCDALQEKLRKMKILD